MRNELHMLQKNKLLLFVMAAIILIPSIYAGVFLSSMWDPYGQLNRLPVAVVNLDEPISWNGKELSIGTSVTESLLREQTMAFRKETPTGARNGLADGTYYMVITIPKDFSANAASLTAKTPQQMTLRYETNPGKNYISSKLSESAMKELKSRVTTEVTQTYVQSMFAQIAAASDGMQQAADGAKALADGGQKLTDGTGVLQDGLSALSDGTGKLENGANTLNTGLIAYTDGTVALADGIHTLKTKTGALADGTQTLYDGSARLTAGIQTMQQSVDSSLSADNVTQMKQAETALLTLNDSIQQLSAAVQSSAADEGLKAQLAALSDSSAKLLPASSQTITALRTGMQQFQTGISQTAAESGTSGLLEGAQNLQTGLSSLNNSVAKPGGLTDKIAQLSNGADRLTAQNQTVLNGSAALCSGSTQLQNGITALSDGSRQLSDGARQLADGGTALQSALSDGADALTAVNGSPQTVTMFSSPVALEESALTTVENNGNAMAAYMMSVGLWVGCLAFCLMYPLTQSEKPPKNGLAWWAQKAGVAYPMALLMALLQIAVLIFANGLAPQNAAALVIVTVVTAICFLSILYFFNVLLGKVGSFLMLIFMVLQLAGSAGTYPIELSGTLAQALHPYMPFTYSVNALRAAISGGTAPILECLLLGGLAAAFTGLTITLFVFRDSRQRAHRPVFYSWLKSNGLA